MAAFDSWGVTSSGVGAGAGNKRGQWGSSLQSGWAVQHRGNQGHFRKGAGAHMSSCAATGSWQKWSALTAPPQRRLSKDRAASGCPSPAATSQPPNRELRIIVITANLEMVKRTGSWAAPRRVAPRAAQGTEARACDPSSGLLWQGVPAAERRMRPAPEPSPPALFPCLFPMVPRAASTALSSAVGAEFRVLLTHICSHDQTWKSTPRVTASLLQEGQYLSIVWSWVRFSAATQSYLKERGKCSWSWGLASVMNGGSAVWLEAQSVFLSSRQFRLPINNQSHGGVLSAGRRTMCCSKTLAMKTETVVAQGTRKT